LFIWQQFLKKRKAFDTSGNDAITIYLLVPANELTKIGPIETPSILELDHERFGIECVSGLPQFDNH
jgi:hypothetical protein